MPMKIWLGVSTFSGIRDQVSASRYTEMHCARLAEFGLTGIDAKQFQVNEGLTALTRGPLE
ncbi:MAG: YdhR family protein [Candidatus Thiodiazotropha sp. (ex. Lucinoma kazani)]